MQDTYDPFSFLLSEIRAFDAGERENWDPYQRQHYLDVLVADEAEEIAWGRRHITVVHGEPQDEVEAEVLDDIFDTWATIASEAAWARIGGLPDHHMTITIAGANADCLLTVAAEVATLSKPTSWQVLGSARGL